MNTAGKVAIGLLVVGVIGGAVLLSSSDAHAAPKPPTPPPPGPTPPPIGPAVTPGAQTQDHDPHSGVVVVPPASGASSPPAVVPPPPGALPSVQPDGSLNVPLPGGGSATVPAGTLPSVTPGPGGGSVLNIPGGGQVPLPPLPAIPGATPPAGAPAATPPSSGPALPSAPSGGTFPVTITASAPTPADTIAVVSAMLANEAQGTQWRSLTSPGLAEWQRSRGLTPDGAFGTGTALRMAKEIGTLPIIRAWPRGSYLEGHWLPDYRASLAQLAQTVAEPQRSELLNSSVREQGQGFGTPPKLITNKIALDNA